MYITNLNTQNHPFCRLQLVVKTYGHFNKPTYQDFSLQSYLKTLGTCLKYQPIVPSLSGKKDKLNVGSKCSEYKLD